MCLSVGGTFGGYVILQNVGELRRLSEGLFVGFAKKSERLLKNYAGNWWDIFCRHRVGFDFCFRMLRIFLLKRKNERWWRFCKDGCEIMGKDNDGVIRDCCESRWWITQGS